MPKKISSATRSPKQAPKTQGKDFHLELLNTAQKLAWAAFQQHDVLFLLGPAGTGKAQPLTAKIMTPSGFTTMGEIKVGDVISTPDGNSARVGGIFPQGTKSIYRIVFHDGSSTECCEDHLWKISSISDGWKDRVVDTKYIIKNHRNPSGRRKYYIATTAPVHHDRKVYEISPYVMGILLGDGCLRGNKPAFTTADSSIAFEVESNINSDYKLWHNGKLQYAIVKKERSNKPNYYTEILNNYGLMGCNSKSKFIPQHYLHGSVDQRIQLLQGLMDSDGTVNKRSGQASYSTSSNKLAADFCQLVQSLGGVARTRIKETSHSPNFVISVCLPNDIAVFNLCRKSKLKKARSKYFPKKYIDRVEYVGEKEAQCIYIESEDHLYLTDDYIVTHNTFLATAFAIKTFLAKDCTKIVLTRPIIEAGEKLGFLPGDFEAKVNPYMMPIYDCMDKLLGYEGPYREKVIAGCEVSPLAYMRGRTFHDAVCLLDEAQNCTMSQLKMFLSRFAEGSKIVITGDPNQSDLYGPCALSDCVRKLADLSGVGVVEFKNNSIVRHPLIGAILDRLGE